MFWYSLQIDLGSNAIFEAVLYFFIATPTEPKRDPFITHLPRVHNRDRLLAYITIYGNVMYEAPRASFVKTPARVD